MTEALVETRDLIKHFPLTRSIQDFFRGREGAAIHAVDGVALQIAPGETRGLIGESGSGKTSLGWLIARLHEPTSGQILYRGRDIAHLAGADLRAWRRRVQIVFQDPVGSLDPRMRPWQIITEPIRAPEPAGPQDPMRAPLAGRLPLVR